MDATGSLDEIAVFVHVVQAGSFTAAARQRNVPKSTLSRAVSRLEETMRSRLLQRSSRKIALTDAGRAFYDRAAPHIVGLREAAEALDTDDQPKGTLRITAPADAGSAFLGDLLVRFAARYPLLHVDVDLSARKQNLVEEGFDAALRAGPSIDDPSLVARRLATPEVRLFAAPSYLARRGTPTTPEELVDHDCVLFRPLDGHNEWSFTGPDGEERRVKVTGRIACNDFSFLRSVAVAGAGIALIPTFQDVRDFDDGSLVRVLPGWSRPAANFYFVYPAARHVPKRVIVFRDFVLEAFGQRCAELGKKMPVVPLPTGVAPPRPPEGAPRQRQPAIGQAARRSPPAP
jgi:DNA-binding transcriptional LysR family regulator